MSLLAAVVLNCIPALPFYCANIHVGCAGRTTIATQRFTVERDIITFGDATIWKIRRQTDRDADILWHKGHRDWIRVEADGRFSLRRYDSGSPMMTRGHCTGLP